ncbi:MAG: D-alanyl-D-alanine carboxypeptidase [Ferruginibacter sp.]
MIDTVFMKFAYNCSYRNYQHVLCNSFKNIFRYCFLFSSAVFILSSCSLSNKISKQATRILLKDSAIGTGHIGISIYEPATDQYWYNYNATKYFVPASNTKLFSLYAGMKYLGDSIIGLRYEIDKDSNLRIQPTGDPSFLHPDFTSQPVFDFLQHFKKITFTDSAFRDNFLGAGWAWDDYKEDYMPQRSNFPIYGNLTSIRLIGNNVTVIPRIQQYIIPEHTNLQNGFDIQKKWNDNLLTIQTGANQHLSVPFSTDLTDIIGMLQDTLHTTVLPGPGDTKKFKNVIHSQPVDALFKPMMYNSDNFFAEQILLMSGNELSGYMNDEKIIDTILNTDLKDIPQRPQWVDGSGLSRYNLFTPQSFVYILNKLKNEFGLERLKHILPTGGTGTLSSYYKKDAGFIFAKTGTLSNHCALSGFIITKKNKLLVFSFLENNFQGSATPVRKAVEKFLQLIREKY